MVQTLHEVWTLYFYGSTFSPDGYWDLRTFGTPKYNLPLGEIIFGIMRSYNFFISPTVF